MSHDMKNINFPVSWNLKVIQQNEKIFFGTIFLPILYVKLQIH